MPCGHKVSGRELSIAPAVAPARLLGECSQRSQCSQCSLSQKLYQRNEQFEQFEDRGQGHWLHGLHGVNSVDTVNAGWIYRGWGWKRTVSSQARGVSGVSGEDIVSYILYHIVSYRNIKSDQIKSHKARAVFSEESWAREEVATSYLLLVTFSLLFYFIVSYWIITSICIHPVRNLFHPYFNIVNCEWYVLYTIKPLLYTVLFSTCSNQMKNEWMYRIVILRPSANSLSIFIPSFPLFVPRYPSPHQREIRITKKLLQTEIHRF